MNIQPHIVFIILDTHRRDRLGLYGYRRGASPNLDRFASQATVFENAISPAQWTIPAHASMFTGEHPTTHLTTQSSDVLNAHFPTLAEHLRSGGYQLTGFCNNPLVGVLDNELKRGFHTFYNYGGAVPSTPARETPALLAPLSQAWERYTQLLRRLSYPIQNAVARSERFFHLSLNPLLVPYWTRLGNFKGNTAASLRDAAHYVRSHLHPAGSRPQFVFINLMETHLPFTPPEAFIRRFAPTYREERLARDFMRLYNTQALRWLLPMDEPFSALEAQTLSEMYDAEVAYQDDLLAQLLEALDRPEIRHETLVLFVADHGEMLGEHGFMGHGLSVHQELVHVPLIVRLPGQTAGRRVSEPVSTAQLFHTLLDAAGLSAERPGVDAKASSLLPALRGFPMPQQAVFSEAYPPNHLTRIIQADHPGLLARFHALSIYRAAYDDGLKLVQIEGAGEQLYDLRLDPGEERPLAAAEPRRRLLALLDLFAEGAQARRPQELPRGATHMDEALRRRLRSLGYLE